MPLIICPKLKPLKGKRLAKKRFKQIVKQFNTTWRKPRLTTKPKKNKFYLIQANHTFGFPTTEAATKYFKNLNNAIKGPWLVVTIHKHL